MKEMIYKGSVENEQKVIDMLDEGIYKGFHYVIVSYGTHPCAYIEIPEGHKLYNASNQNEFYDIACHGGINFNTYTGLPFVPIKNPNKGHYIGWSFSTVGYDYIFGICYCGKKWTTKEIFEDVKNVIEQLIKS